MHIGVLGSLTVERAADRRLWMPSANQRRLLSVLALDAGHVVSADRLCEILELSSGALRTTVSRLRVSIGKEHLQTLAPGYVLSVTTDIAEFDRLVIEARAADPEETVGLADLALLLWRGEVLDEFRDEFWAVPEVARLDELRASLIELRAASLLSSGRPEQAISDLSAHIVRHPLRERPRVVVMQSLAATGRTTEALRVFQDFRRHLVDETGTEPSDTIRSVERSIASGSAGPLVPTTLPAQRTSFIGRTDLVDQVGTLLGEHRLVTLVGPGGVGKTRLAIETARQLTQVFPGGVFFADLTRVSAEVEVAAEVLRSMKAPVRVGQGDDEAIAGYLSHRSVLLVVDNCEHVVERVAEVIDDLLVATPNTCVLSTSRELLRLRGECLVRVPPLAVDGARSSGSRLFTERALSMDGTLVAGGSEPECIPEIVRRLDGIPLAIELAAAQTATLSVSEILGLLNDRFVHLAQRLRRVPARQQTLAASIDWSYDLLSAEEQRAFRRLTVCAGALSATTAAGVLERSEPDARQLLDVLTSKSLLVPLPTADEPTGYSMLESLREYGRERLAEHGESVSAELGLEEALLPRGDVATDWTLFVNSYLCAADVTTMVEESTRLAAGAEALAAGRLDHASFLFCSVSYRDEPGALRARADVVNQLAARRAELSPMAWLAANAAKLLLERSARDYSACFETADAVLATLDPGHPARSWFDLWRLALTTAIDPDAGLAMVDPLLAQSGRTATRPLDWTLSQILGTKANGLAVLHRLDEADAAAVEAAEWAPVGQESRDQILALRVWLSYLRNTPISKSLREDIDRQAHDLGLAELCAAPGALGSSGTFEVRAARVLAVARKRPRLDIATPYLLAFAWLSIEEGDHERARRLVGHAEMYDASTQVGLLYAHAAIECWTEQAWDRRRAAVVSRYLRPEQERAATLGVATLDDEVEYWEHRLAALGTGDA